MRVRAHGPGCKGGPLAEVPAAEGAVFGTSPAPTSVAPVSTLYPCPDKKITMHIAALVPKGKSAASDPDTGEA